VRAPSEIEPPGLGRLLREAGRSMFGDSYERRDKATRPQRHSQGYKPAPASILGDLRRGAGVAAHVTQGGRPLRRGYAEAGPRLGYVKRGSTGRTAPRTQSNGKVS